MKNAEKIEAYRVPAPPIWMPDGKGGFTPCPYVLTEDEAILFLRLDTVNIKNPAATLREYRKDGLLKAVQISKRIFYPVSELVKFINNSMRKNPR